MDHREPETTHDASLLSVVAGDFTTLQRRQSVVARAVRPADDPCTASGNVERDPSGAVSGVRKTGRRRQGSQSKQRQDDFEER